jgi:hypothetical protein
MLSIVKLRLLSLRDNYMVFLVMTAMALGFTAVFGISFNTYRPSVIIVDEDNTPYSAEFIEELKQNQIFKFVDSDKENAIAGVEEGKILAALIIDEGSSIIRRSGLWRRAAPILSLLFIPPEYFLTLSFNLSFNPIISATSFILSFNSAPLRPYRFPQNLKFSYPVSVG